MTESEPGLGPAAEREVETGSTVSEATSAEEGAGSDAAPAQPERPRTTRRPRKPAAATDTGTGEARPATARKGARKRTTVRKPAAAKKLAAPIPLPLDPAEVHEVAPAIGVDGVVPERPPRRRRSGGSVPTLVALADLPEDAEGRVELIISPMPKAEVSEDPAISLDAEPQPPEEAVAPSVARLVGWPAMGVLAAIVVVVFAAGMLVTH